MSDFAALAIVVALGIANALLFVFMDKWVVSRSDAIALGASGGYPSPVEHRRYRLRDLNIPCCLLSLTMPS